MACSAAGARVVGADIAAESGQHTVSAIREAGGDAIFVATNVADEEQVAALAVTLSRYGRLDGAFNNAGLAQPNVLLRELTAEQWCRTQSINYDGIS